MQFIILNQTFHGYTIFLQRLFCTFFSEHCRLPYSFWTMHILVATKISYSYMTNNYISNVLNRDGYPLNELLSRMQAFNANIKVYSQLLYHKKSSLKT